MPDLGVDFLGIALKNPTVLASGILGVTRASLAFCARAGAGALTIKSITKEPRDGHPLPIACAFEAGLLNAVGYAGPGYEDGLSEYGDLKDVGAPVFGSIVAGDAEEYAFLAESFINQLAFDAFEIPLSCPHTPGFGELAGHSTPEATHEIVTALKSVTGVPLIVKLSANVSGIGAVAKAAEEAGADAICAVNTLGPGVVLDTPTSKRVLGFGSGGMSGAALRPVALRAVAEVYEHVEIPIIGTGGISTGEDAVQMLMAGASLVGIGTAVVTRGVDVFSMVSAELESFMDDHGFASVSELRGLGHGQ